MLHVVTAIDAEGPIELPFTTTAPDIDAGDIDAAMTNIVTPLLSGPVHVQVETATQDVPADVLRQITVIPVETAEDVLREALGLTLPRADHVLLPSLSGAMAIGA